MQQQKSQGNDAAIVGGQFFIRSELCCAKDGGAGVYYLNKELLMEALEGQKKNHPNHESTQSQALKELSLLDFDGSNHSILDSELKNNTYATRTELSLS